MPSAFNDETGVVIVIGSPLENDEHEREHLEFLVQELLGILSGISALPRPVSCLIHIELMAALKESQLKMAQLVEDTIPQLEAFQRGESTEDEFRATIAGLFEDLEARIAAADAELEASYQEAMQQVLAEALFEALGDGLEGLVTDVTEENLEKLFGSLPLN